jgi:hypothetical protein
VSPVSAKAVPEPPVLAGKSSVNDGSIDLDFGDGALYAFYTRSSAAAKFGRDRKQPKSGDSAKDDTQAA